MKVFKKYFTILATAGFAMAAAATSQAAFQSKGTVPLTATVQTQGIQEIRIVSASIQNRAGDANAGALTWGTAAQPGAGWLVSDQYIKLVTSITQTKGGVQIYTDNVNSVPAYTGTISSVTASPAGLVNNSDTTNALPTAWRASTFTLTTAQLPAVGVDPTADPNTTQSSLWLFHEDRSQVANVTNGAKFNNGDPFITVYAAPVTTLTGGETLDTNGNIVPGASTTVSGGVHFAQKPTSFGGFSTSAATYIYTEANFNAALALSTYNTTKMILEAYSL